MNDLLTCLRRRVELFIYISNLEIAPLTDTSLILRLLFCRYMSIIVVKDFIYKRYVKRCFEKIPSLARLDCRNSLKVTWLNYYTKCLCKKKTCFHLSMRMLLIRSLSFAAASRPLPVTFHRGKFYSLEIELEKCRPRHCDMPAVVCENVV